MHKKDFFPFILCSYQSFSLSYLEPQIIFPCCDIGPTTATLDSRPRHWIRDRDIGPATATLDPRPRLWTRDTRPATISQTRYFMVGEHVRAVSASEFVLHNEWIKIVQANYLWNNVFIIYIPRFITKQNSKINISLFSFKGKQRAVKAPHSSRVAGFLVIKII